MGGLTLKIHLYGGLVCAWYLVAYGVTSLGFNHPGLLPERRGPAVTWEQPLELPDIADNLELGEAVQRELDLIGWVLPWNLERKPSGDLRFELSRPGRQYLITTDRAARRVSVEERTTGLASALHFLHGSTEGIPGTRFLYLWSAYTEITTGLVLYLAVSGVVLWARRSRDRRSAALMLTASLGVSVALMAWVCLIG